MTFTEQQVEWIVVEVLRRLGFGVAMGREANHGSPAANPPSSAAPPTATHLDELRFNDGVITLWLIEGRLRGVTRVIIPPRAVVTPAVKDELKQRQIELVREGRT